MKGFSYRLLSCAAGIFPAVFMWEAFLLNIFLAIYAAISLRPLYWEGVHWYFMLLNSGHFFIDLNFMRYLDVLPQLPTWLILTLAPSAVSPRWLLLLFCLSYVLFPILFTLATVGHLIWRRQADFLPIFFLGFSLILQSCLASPHTIVPFALTVFWLAFFFTLFQREESNIDLIVIIALLLALSFSHESSIFHLLLLAAVAFFRSLSMRFKSRHAIVFFCAVLSIFWMIYRLSIIAPDNMRFYFNDIQFKWGMFRWYALVCFLINIFFMGFYWIGFRRKSAAYLYLFLIAAASSLFLWLGDVEQDFSSFTKLNLFEAHSARTSAVFFSLVLAVICVVLEFKGKGFLQTNKKFFAIAAAFCLFISALYDYRLTENWRDDFAVFNFYRNSSKEPCEFISAQQRIPNSILADRLSLYSLALLNAGEPVRVLFDEKSHGSDACQQWRENKMITMGPQWQIELNCRGYFGCSQVFQIH